MGYKFLEMANESCLCLKRNRSNVCYQYDYVRSGEVVILGMYIVLLDFGKS